MVHYEECIISSQMDRTPPKCWWVCSNPCNMHERWSVDCYYTLVKPHHPPIFNILSLIFIFFLINFPTYCYTLSNFFHKFYIFISSLLSTLISHLLYPFIFLDFLLFSFPSSYYKFTILFSILFIIFSRCGTWSLS